MLKQIKDYLSILKRKFKYKKNSYSFNSVDLIVDYIFKNKKVGFYLDIGAQHPVSNNNTFLPFHLCDEKSVFALLSKAEIQKLYFFRILKAFLILDTLNIGKYSIPPLELL